MRVFGALSVSATRAASEGAAVAFKRLQPQRDERTSRSGKAPILEPRGVRDVVKTPVAPLDQTAGLEEDEHSRSEESSLNGQIDGRVAPPSDQLTEIDRITNIGF